MKIYTEEQMIQAFDYGKTLEPFDCFEDMIDSLAPIELPSEEDIVFAADDIAYYGSDAVCFEAGAEWVINHIKQQDNV